MLGEENEKILMKNTIHGEDYNFNTWWNFRYWTMDRSLQRKLSKTNYQHIKRLCRGDFPIKEKSTITLFFMSLYVFLCTDPPLPQPDRGQLFEDQDFPPGNKAIYSHKKPGLHPILWMRPHVSHPCHAYCMRCICKM